MKKQISMLLAAAMLLSLTACSSSGAKSESTASEKAADGSAKWKIGAEGPLSGGAAVYGNAVANGAELAVKEINEKGGINGYQIEFKKADDEHDQEKAVNAFNSLKDWGMQVLVGPTTSAPTIAVGSEAEADNLFVLTPTGSAVECTAPKNVFRVCFSDPAQGTKSAQYIGEHKLGKKVGVLYDSSDVYSSGIRDAFVEEAKKQGIELTEDQQFTADSNKDFSTQLQKLRDAGADLVFLPFYYTEAALVLKQANTMGYKPIFFGCDGMDGLLDVENFDSSLAEGLMLLTPYSADAEDERTKNFVKSYEAQYGDTPIQFAADAYDAVYAIKAAAEKEDLKPSLSVSEIGDGLEKGMTEIQLDGLTGSGMRWSAEGDVDKEPKAVRVENGSYVSAE